MSELRYNVVSQDWVIIATERARRPHAIGQGRPSAPPVPAHDPQCPFCPGNEGDGADETGRRPGVEGWQVRSLRNKFPALSPAAVSVPSAPASAGAHRHMPGYGVHEVLVEHPRHDLCFAELPAADVVEVLRLQHERFNALSRVIGIAAVTLFKNQGPSAGASQRHPHSQLVATPVVPHHLQARLDGARRYYAEHGACILCDMLAQELDEQVRVILETEHFVAFVPFAPISPFLYWIVPRRHAAVFGTLDDAELVDLAGILRRTLGKLHRGLDNPDYNFTVRSAPFYESGDDFFHWHITVIPRLAHAAGFELGSGMFINASVPEECAAYLRDVE